MKRKTIRGMALGLAATSIITITSGCSKKDVSIPDTASIVGEDADNIYNDYTYYTGGTYVFKGQEYKEAHDPSDEYIVNEYNGISYDNGLNTNDLFFIRIDGKIYLATKLTDINENNIILKYYAVDTGEFLGQTLDINWYARSTKDIENIIPPGGTKTVEYKVSVDDDLKDKNYFNGEYGLGKNLCRESIVNASSILSESVLTKEQIDILLTDSLLTASLVEKYHYPNSMIYSREDYTFIPLRYTDVFGLTSRDYTVGFNGETSTYLNKMYQFEIEDSENIRKIVGYRASTNENDSGFNYIYDIESSSYLDLSQFNVLNVKKVVTSKTVEEIRQELEMYHSIDNLKVVSTVNLEGDDVFEKYYIAMRSDYVMDNTYEYEILGEKELVALSGSYDGSRLCIAKSGSLKTTSTGDYNGMVDSLKECLARNDLSNYIKDVYTEEELSLLLIKLRNKELDLGTPINEIKEDYKKISIEDIVVVDTSKESGESVLAEGEKRFYVLMPYEQSSSIKAENPDVKYYEIYDNTGFGAISFERKFVVIDNVFETFYAVLKTDGELECVSSLEDVLKENGLEDNIREKYALMDLQIISDKINEKQKSLILN